MRKILISLLLPTILSAKILFFVVDISSSMKRGFLFKSVRDSLVSYVNQSVDVGDHVVLIGFGSDVNIYEDRVIESNVGKVELMTTMHKLDAQDRFTWMTKAFATVGNKLSELNRKNPDMLKEIYVLTDGINEPPPDKKDSLKFQDIIKQYIGEFKKRNIFTYYISFGVTPSIEIEEFLSSLEIEPVVHERTTTIIFQPKVSLELTSKMEKQLETEITVALHYQVKELLKSAGKKITLKISNKPEDVDIKFVKDPVITILERNQKDSLLISISGFTETKEFSFDVILIPSDTNMIVIPNRHEISVKVHEPTPIEPKPIAWIIAAVVVGIIVIISLAQLLATPRFPDASLVQLDEKDNITERYNLKTYQKLGNNKLNISGDINISGIKAKTFVLIAEKRGGVTMKILAQDVSVRIVTADLELQTGDTYTLKHDDKFTIANITLRYET